MLFFSISILHPLTFREEPIFSFIDLEYNQAMRIAVTGGAGFIGSAFARHMMARDDVEALAVFDALTYAANPHNIDSIMDDSRFSFIKGDITDKALVFSLFEKERFDIVVNYAAQTHVDNSVKDSSPFLESNIIGVGVLLDASRMFAIKRFHQVSTDEVYGDLPLESTSSFTEDSPLCPGNPYSASKAAADLLILSYHRTYSLPFTISRSVNNYGPFQNVEKLIPLMITRLMRNETLPVYSRGENIRSWIHVDDHSRAVEKILFNGREGEIYNISSGFEIRNIDLVKRLIALTGKSEDLISYVSDRPGHDRRYSLCTKKLEKELSFSPSISFEEGLDQTLSWYLKNSDLSS